MRIRAITFDYGGTLDGPASHWLDRFIALYRECGVDSPAELIKVAFYAADAAAYTNDTIAEAGLAELIDFHVRVQLGGLGLDDATLRRSLANRFVERSQAALAESKRVLEQLAGTFRLGVISNFYGNVERILSDAGIRPLLEVVADSNRIGASKPDSRIFAHTISALGTQPAETMHVGDSFRRDILAARQLGWQAAWLLPEGDATREQPAGEIRIRSLNELCTKLMAPDQLNGENASL